MTRDGTRSSKRTQQPGEVAGRSNSPQSDMAISILEGLTECGFVFFFIRFFFFFPLFFLFLYYFPVESVWLYWCYSGGHGVVRHIYTPYIPKGFLVTPYQAHSDDGSSVTIHDGYCQGPEKS
jgi:hypothetical protein